MRLQKIAPWLLPTLIAPVLGSSFYVWLIARSSSLPTALWYAVAVAAAAFALVLGWTTVVADVALLKARVRDLPAGWRVWLMGFASPWPVFFCWQKLAKVAITGIPQLLLVFFLPMLATAVVLRVVLGSRPSHWTD